MATTITRKEYDAAGAGTVLGLGCTTKSEEFDGAVSVGGISIDDAFNVDEIALDASGVAATSPMAKSTGIMSLAANIASVKLQPRLIPHAFSAPKVNGFECTKNATLQDGVWLDCGTTQTSATPQTVSALNASDDAVKALMQEVSQVLGIPCASLWQIGDTSGVVSFTLGSGYTDGEALMDGRSTMAGYPVSDGAEMVWTALGSAQLMALNASIDTNTGKSLLCRLLTMLGMPETMAQQEQAALSGGRLAEPTVSAGGEIELKNDDDTNPLIVGTEAKSRLLYKNGTSNAPWISVNADGGSTLLWPENKGDVFALLAGMAKKAMDSICGIGLVGVGKDGGVMSWMVQVTKDYPEISFANLIKAYFEFNDIKYTFGGTKRQVITGNIQSTVPAFTNYVIDIQTRPNTMQSENQVLVVFGRSSFYGNKIFWDFGGGDSANRIWTNQVFSKGNWYNLRYSNSGSRYIKDITTGSTLVSGSVVSYSASSKYFCFGSGTTSTSLVIIYNSDMSTNAILVPFKRKIDGVEMYGLLDLITNNFAGNESITYSLE